jgi:glycosyltransferase involved in cell wall biosynthesis
VRIGIDVTGLYITKAGIYYHSFNLLQHLLALDSEHEFVLLDYAPVRGDRTLPFDLRSLESERVSVAEVRGPRRYKLIDWKRMDFFGGRFTAQCVDAVLDQPWKWWIARAARRQLNAVLAQLDVLHASDVTQFVPKGASLVSTVHDLSPVLFPELHTPQNRALFKRKMCYVQERAQAIIAVSEHTKRDLVKVLAIPEERVHVVYNAAAPGYHPIRDRGEIRRVTRKYGVPGSGYILHVGTLEPRKNLVRLVEAYAVALDHCGDRVPPLVLAGGKGWLYEEIFHSVERLGLQQRVIFTGFVDDEDLPALFNGALFFVYPSLYEGFGIPVLEAMACGVPVITSNASSLPEIVGEAGVLVDPIDAGALAAALMALLDDLERRAALRAAGLTRAVLFSWERAARETLEVYAAAVRRRLTGSCTRGNGNERN